MLTNKDQHKLIKKIEGVEKLERHARGKALRALYVTAVGMGAALAIYGVLVFNNWSYSHKIVIRTPVILQSPVVIQTKVEAVNIPRKSPVEPVLAAEPTPAPHFTEKDIVLSYAHGEILWKIYQLESGRGKADYCRLEGKGFGGFGVLSDGKIVCYDTFSLAAERAEYWLVQNGIDNDVPTTLCKWSGYGAVSNCPYYKTYLSL